MVGRKLYDRTTICFKYKTPEERQADQTCMSRYLIATIVLGINSYQPVEICHYLNRLQCLKLAQITMKIDTAQLTSVRKAGLTMYESLSLGTQKRARCPY